ncbi:alpha/beta hydrolase [Subtercola boreus]|nr:alpha/beta hydrolase [Subtercola boreus]
MMLSPELAAVLKRFQREGDDVAPEDFDLGSLRSLIDLQAKDQLTLEGAHFETVQLGGVPAERVTVPSARETDFVLFFHGGAYMFGSSRGYRGLTSTLAAAAGATVLSIDYRLAPEHPFPAAVLDTTAAYLAVLESGISASKIVFAGDSAGGALVLATMLSARDAGLPLPAAGYTMSAWLDLAGEGASFTELEEIDPIMTAEGAHGGAAAYLQGTQTRHPWASPLYADLTGLPPLLLQVGSTEMFLDDTTRTARKAALAGVHTEMQVWPDMPHVWHRFPSTLPEAAAALKSGGRFVRHNLEQTRNSNGHAASQ